MKKQIIFLFFLTALAHVGRTQVVSGVYKGTMEVDSPKNTINFELTLKEKKGKITGYCYRLFIIGDTVFYNLLKVTAKKEKGMLVVEDERSVSNNFEVSTKGIKTRFFFKLSDIIDTATVLPGEWQTTFWKNYIPLKGSITVIRENKYKTTQIYSRLTDLNLLPEMELEAPDVVVKNDLEVKEGKKDNTELQLKDTVATISISKTKIDNAVAITDRPTLQTQTAKTSEIIKPESIIVNTDTLAEENIITKPLEKTKADNAVARTDKPSISNQIAKTSEITKAEPVIETNNPEIQLQKNTDKVKSGADLNVNNPMRAAPNKTNVSPGLIALQKRKSEAIQPQSLLVYEDTITLAIYDNGEIDGDTVSIFINDEQVVTKVGLSAKAYKVDIPVNKDRLNKVELFAENLGKIPPNTGLMVIYTGEQRYQVFFTATLEKNAVIYLERKE